MADKALADSNAKKNIISSEEAEAIAREYLKQRHSRIERVFFRTMYREGDTWTLQGDIQFKRAYFFDAAKSLKVQVNSNTREVVSCEEVNLAKT